MRVSCLKHAFAAKTDYPTQLIASLKPRGWIHGRSVDSDLEMQVRARRISGRAYGTDCLASLDILAHRDERLRAVPVSRRNTASVSDPYVISVAANPTGNNYPPIRWC